VTIAQALFDSSALPFIFKTFKDQTGIFDGGLVNNFPSNVLLDDEASFGHVAGFSFQPQPVQLTFSSLKDFAGALISTMMDNATNQALSKLPEGDVHYIETTTSTLDFRAALEDDLKGANYKRYVDQVGRFLDDLLARKRSAPRIIPPEELTRRVMHLHETLRAKQKLHVTKIVLELKSNSLKIKNLADPASADEFYLSNEVIVSSPVFTFGSKIMIEEEVFDVGDINPMVLDEKGNSIGVTTFPISPSVFKGQVHENNVVLFFHEPLNPGQKYRISFSGRAQEILYDLAGPKRNDAVNYLVRNMDSVDEVDLIAYIPKAMSKPTLAQNSGPVPPGMVWKEGRELTRSEFGEAWNAYPEFYPIGWRGRDLKRNDIVGFKAHSNS
jgi:hypothetical protein